MCLDDACVTVGGGGGGVDKGLQSTFKCPVLIFLLAGL